MHAYFQSLFRYCTVFYIFYFSVLFVSPFFIIVIKVNNKIKLFICTIISLLIMKSIKWGGGMDIGTTFSAIAVSRGTDSQAEILEDKDGEHHIPSYVFYDDKERAQVGKVALKQEPTATVYDNKRFIGQTFQQMEEFVDNYPFKIVKDPDSDFIIYELSSESKEFKKTPLEVATDQIAHYVDLMDQRLDMNNCVAITGTHPAYFSSTQKYTTLNAGMLFYY